MKTFINWSNHPYERWSSKQLEVARSLGELMYIEFPKILPEDSPISIKEQAESSVVEIIEKYDNPNDVVIMLQGEMTFLYHALKLFEQKGYRVVAATTKKLPPKFTPDGKEIKEFEFVGFRDYFVR